MSIRFNVRSPVSPAILILIGGLMLAVTGCNPASDQVRGTSTVPTPQPDQFPYSLNTIPLSDELSEAIKLETLSLAKPVPCPADSILAHRDRLVTAIQDIESRSAAGYELYRNWQADPANFVWIAAATRYEYLLHRQAGLDSMLTHGILADTTSAAGAFAAGCMAYGYGSRGHYFRMAKAVSDSLPELDQLILERKLAMLESQDGRHLEAVRRLLTALPRARIIGSQRFTARFWYSITLYLDRADRLDDALHAAALGHVCADRDRITPLMGRFQILVARVLQSRHEFSAALDNFSAAADFGQRENLHWVVQSANHKAGALCSLTGTPDRALVFDSRALAHSIANRDSLNTPRNMINIADDYRLMGQMDSCLVYQQRAHHWVDLFPNKRNKATLPSKEAEYYCQIGDYASADSLLALASDRSRGASLAVDEAQLLLGLILNGLEMGRPAMAYRALARLETLRESIFDQNPDQNLVADFELATADFLLTRGEFRLAHQALKRAANATEDEDVMRRWNQQRTSGQLALRRDDLQSAADHFANCRQLAETAGNADLSITSRFLLGNTLQVMGRHDLSRELFIQGDADSSFGGNFRTRLTNLLYLGRSWAATGQLDTAKALLLQAIDQSATHSPPDLMASLHLELGRVLVTKHETQAGRDHFSQALTHLKRGRSQDRMDVLDTSFAAIRREIGEALVDLDSSGLVGDADSDAVLTSLRTAALMLYSKPMEFTDTQLNNAADRNGCLVVFALGEHKSHLWIGTAGAWSHVDLPARNVLRALVEPVVADMKRPGRPADQSALNQLSSLLLKPLVPLWKTDTPLIILSDSFLHNLPWAALSWPGDGASLVVEHGPTMETSGLDHLMESPSHASGKTGPNSLLALGYDGAIGDADRLRHAEDEARAIASSWSAGSVQTLIGTEASWTGLQAAGLTTVDILHIASHATITQGLASESCLRLAQTDQPEPVDVSMIAALDLDTELVFLSCCEAGRHQGTSSGVMDFSQAFIEAGAKSVLSSSVRVDDRAGLELAQLFYRHWLAGKSRPEALRAAQLEMMQQTGRWDHPFYWSFYRLISGTNPTR